MALPLPARIFEPGFAEAFAARLTESGGCLLWTGLVSDSGYGRLRVDGRMYQAHRVALALHLGRDLEPDELALHACDNRRCCYGQHLRPGDDAENAADRAARGRGHVNPRGRNSASGSRVVPFRLPPDLADELRAYAEERGQNVSGLLRGMVERLLA